MRFNNLVIGGGVIGLSVSKHLSKSTILIEKNKSFGLETSSRNSQVIHSGLYYPENTLKTSLCIKGRKLLYKYLNDKKIPFRKCTKWIVSDHTDLLQNLLEKATKLQIPCRFVSDNVLKEEPNLLAKYAILLPETGILDAYKYMESLEADVLEKNMIQYNTTVVGIKQLYPGYLVQCKQGNDFYDIEADRVVNCAGLYSATIAKMIGYDYKLYYAKGHYYKPNKILSNRLIYPLPDLHSLGLHLTVGIDGENLFGPDVYFQENLDYSFQGDSFTALQSARQYMHVDSLTPAFTGIRPKLSQTGFHDFVINKDLNGFVNLIGIESPGLTSSLAIGEYIAKILD